VVSLTITRWPLARDHPRGRGRDLHHQRGRHRSVPMASDEAR